MEIHPLEGVVDIQHLVSSKIEVVIENALDVGTCNVIDKESKQCHEGQHLDRRETHLLLATDVVADEVARAQKKLQQ